MLQVVRLADKSIIANKRRRLELVRQLSPKNNQESEYLLHTLKRSSERKNTLYIAIKNSKEIKGILALSLNKPQGSPEQSWLIIDYLYVHPELRGKIYANSGVKSSAILMARALDVASQINTHIELDTLALELAHDKLVNVYEAFGFKELKHLKKKYWMGLKLS